MAALHLGDGDGAAHVAGQVACLRVRRRERRREGEKIGSHICWPNRCR